MKNWLVLLANGQVHDSNTDYRHITVYAETKQEAETMGEVAAGVIPRYWFVESVTALE